MPSIIDPQAVRTNAVVYMVFSPKFGPGHRVYTDEDLVVEGGTHAIERVLEEETYWFVRLGEIQGEVGPRGATFQTSDIARLLPPPAAFWRTGRRNPAFGGSELGHLIFREIFHSIQCMLDTWKREEDGAMEAYALKEVNVDSEGLAYLVNGLHSFGEAHDVVNITVIRHWYDPLWPGPQLCDDLVLAEFSFSIPIQVKWSVREKLLAVHALSLAAC